MWTFKNGISVCQPSLDVALHRATGCRLKFCKQANILKDGLSIVFCWVLVLQWTKWHHLHDWRVCSLYSLVFSPAIHLICFLTNRDFLQLTLTSYICNSEHNLNRIKKWLVSLRSPLYTFSYDFMEASRWELKVSLCLLTNQPTNITGTQFWRQLCQPQKLYHFLTSSSCLSCTLSQIKVFRSSHIAVELSAEVTVSGKFPKANSDSGETKPVWGAVSTVLSPLRPCSQKLFSFLWVVVLMWLIMSACSNSADKQNILGMYHYLGIAQQLWVELIRGRGKNNFNL